MRRGNRRQELAEEIERWSRVRGNSWGKRTSKGDGGIPFRLAVAELLKAFLCLRRLFASDSHFRCDLSRNGRLVATLSRLAKRFLWSFGSYRRAARFSEKMSLQCHGPASSLNSSEMQFNYRFGILEFILYIKIYYMYYRLKSRSE